MEHKSEKILFNKFLLLLLLLLLLFVMSTMPFEFQTNRGYNLFA